MLVAPRPRSVGGSAWVGALETERLVAGTRHQVPAGTAARPSDNPDPSSWKVPAPTLGIYSLAKGLRPPAQELSLP